MQILVTGSGGFLGKNLIPALLAARHTVFAVSRRAEDFVIKSDRLQHVVCDLSRPSRAFEKAVQDSEAIIHLASDTTPRNSAGSLLADAQGSLIPTLNLLELVRASGTSKLLVYASSGGTVYGPPEQTPIPESHPTNPASSYGVGKLTCEHMVRLTAQAGNMPYVILRISNPYGPHQHTRRKQGVIGAWIRAGLAGEPVEIWGDGSAVRDYIHVSDVVTAVGQIIRTPPPSGIYNLGSGQGASLLEIVRMLNPHLGRPLKVVHRPMFGYDVKLNILCINKLKSSIPWDIRTPLETGLCETVRWVAAQPAT